MESVKLSTKVGWFEPYVGVKDEFEVLYSANGLKLLQCPYNTSDYVIKQGTKVIADHAFSCCKKISEIVLPKGVEGIGESAFECCYKLSKIVLPEGLKEIGEEAFNKCSSLSEIVIPEDVQEIGESAFECCDKLSKIVIPERVKEIENGVFRHCRSLSKIVIPEGVKKIGSYAFSGCSSLSEIVLPEGVEEIGKSAFYNCRSLSKIVLPEGVKRIGSYAFSGCSSLSEIVLPEGLEEIGEDVFSNCSLLSEIVLPEGVKKIKYENKKSIEFMKCFLHGKNPNNIAILYENEEESNKLLEKIKRILHIIEPDVNIVEMRCNNSINFIQFEDSLGDEKHIVILKGLENITDENLNKQIEGFIKFKTSHTIIYSEKPKLKIAFVLMLNKNYKYNIDFRYLNDFLCQHELK